MTDIMRPDKFKQILLLAVVLIMPVQSDASEQALRYFLKSTTTLAADFEQTIYSEQGRVIDHSTGKVYLSRPGKFRWDYHAEEGLAGQQLVADGEQLFLFDPDLEQVSQRSMEDALAQVPSLLLVQNAAAIDELFEIGEISVTDGLSWAVLEPLDENASYQSLMLGFNGKDLQRITLRDGLGNETRVLLSEVQTNIRLAKARFKFVAPEGADVFVE